MIPVERWRWFGDAGHFICAYRCKFHLCTQVGKFLISTVGKMAALEAPPNSGTYEEIGCFRLYETLVFKLGKERCSGNACNCGLPRPSDWCEIDGNGYNNAGDANKGHLELCRKYAKV